MSNPIIPTPQSRFAKKADINMVPYIDVMLVLLVIFMITAPFITQGVDIQLPETQAQTLNSNEKTLIIRMDEQSRLYVNIGEAQELPLSMQGLLSLLSTLDNPSERSLHIEADKQLPYEQVVHLISQLQQQGFSRIGLITQPLQ
ncbi:MAG: protein TolR [Pseudomonadota bacterium]|nr:protein TolR [Pseudomonadota bacterium]